MVWSRYKKNPHLVKSGDFKHNLVANHHYWDIRLAENALRYAAKEQLFEARATMGTNHDQVRI